jgi:serine/threonine protein kinase/ankyrin repeat protein
MRHYVDTLILCAFLPSFDDGSIHSPLSLILEFAPGTLKELLTLTPEEVDLGNCLSLCNDTASGLDVLHDHGFIHGDLKPENILIFEKGGRFIAKLADFGHSVDDIGARENGIRLGGTVGWQAPEVEIGQYLKPAQLMKADNYSFGLLAWSTLARAGQPPPSLIRSHTSGFVKDGLEQYRAVMEPEQFDVLEDAVCRLLHNEPSERPSRLADFFPKLHDTEETKSDCYGPPEPDAEGSAQEGKEEFEHASEDQASLSDGSIQYQDSSGDYFQRENKIILPAFSWEASGLPAEFIAALGSRFSQSPRDIEPRKLFTMFLARTYESENNLDSDNDAIQFLLVSALQGCYPAKAVVPRVLEYLDWSPPPEVEAHIGDWLKIGVCTGSILARHYLSERDPAGYSEALDRFRRNGGYNLFYSLIDMEQSHGSTFINRPTEKNEHGYSYLHWLASCGSHASLREFLDSTILYDIDEKTSQNETPLYLACARGSWDIAYELLDHGASASTTCTAFEISCVHWLFNFDEEFQGPILDKLLHSGADTNAKAACPMPFLHYPLSLPGGTPLHWAVVLSDHSAIKVLVSRGADVHIRDGCDPYHLDDRIRILNHFGGPDREAFSVSEIKTKGLSPLDYSAMEHDPYIFELIISSRKEVNLNSVDEEGLSVLHRLGAYPLQYTRKGEKFSKEPFRGSRAKQKANLSQTVESIIRLGGDLELLSTPQSHLTQEQQGGWKFESRTPLMMAALRGRPIIVETLLKAGARCDTANDEGATALFCCSEGRSANPEIARLLCDAGADVNHHQRDGTSPLIKMASGKWLQMVDILLSFGADIGEKATWLGSSNSGSNVFALLSSPSAITDGSYDVQVSELLAKHLFSVPDADIKRRLINEGNTANHTLLWLYARDCMGVCVEALLRHGADVNIAGIEFQERDGDDDGRGRVVDAWYETPLDAVVEMKNQMIKEMEVHRNYGVREFETICQRWDDLINMLRDAGGIHSSADVTTFAVDDVSASAESELARRLSSLSPRWRSSQG